MNYLETQDGNRSGIDMVSTTQGSYNCIAIVTGKNVETGELRSFSWYGDDLDQLRKSLLERCNKGPLYRLFGESNILQILDNTDSYLLHFIFGMTQSVHIFR